MGRQRGELARLDAAVADSACARDALAADQAAAQGSAAGQLQAQPAKTPWLTCSALRAHSCDFFSCKQASAHKFCGSRRPAWCIPVLMSEYQMAPCRVNDGTTHSNEHEELHRGSALMMMSVLLRAELCRMRRQKWRG